MSWWTKFRTLDPALLRAVFVSVIALAGSLGYVVVSDQRSGAIWGVITAVLALAQGVSTRDAVTPNAKVLAFINDPSKPSTSRVIAGKATVPEHRAAEVADAAVREAA